MTKGYFKRLGLTLFATTALSSCSLFSNGFDEKMLEEAPAYPSYTKLCDFSKGYVDGFYFANGYGNASPFNCKWSNDNGKIENGLMTMTLNEEDGVYYGAEYRTEITYGYGFYCASIKAADCPGVITSFFLYTDNPVWDEIDVEILGKNMNQVQFNYFVSGTGNHGYVYDLGFDSSKDFHEYGFYWLKDSITWYIDGLPVYMVKGSLPSHPSKIMANLWNCAGIDGWSGRFDPSRLPIKAEYQYFGYFPAQS